MSCCCDRLPPLVPGSCRSFGSCSSGCIGVRDVLAKSLGSPNAINVVHATVAALQSLEQPESVAKRRGKAVEDVAPAALLRARETVGS